MTRNPSIESLPRETAKALGALTSPGSGILLAVSGGSDSTGLLHLAALAAPELNLKLSVGFVDHGLRAGVDRELALVRGHAARLGIDVHPLFVPREEAAMAKERGSIQAWAREMRYELLVETAQRLGLSFIATGHTVDDQAETVLLRIIRGTGLDGLAGIAASRTVTERISLIRPLLRFGRAAIREWLEKNGIGWAEDPSNMNARFSRVRVRSEILPVMASMQQGIAGRIAALADEARSAVSLIERVGLEENNFLQALRLSAGVKIDRASLEELPDYMLSRAIRFAIKRVRCDLSSLERTHIEPIQNLIRTGKTGGPLPLPGEAKVYVDKGSLFAFPGPLPPRPGGEDKTRAVRRGVWRAGSATLGVQAEIRSSEPSRAQGLVLRTRRVGDRVWRSRTKVKELFIERAVPRIYRDFVPLLARGDRVVSIPGLLENRDPKIQVHWVIEPSSPMLDIGLNEQHSNSLKKGSTHVNEQNCS